MINGDIAGMVDRLIIRDSQPLHNSTYEIDGTPSDNGEEEYGKLVIDTIAKKYLITIANIKIIPKYLANKNKLLRTYKGS